MQSELRLVKEFRKKRAQMQRELDDVCISGCRTKHLQNNLIVMANE